MTQVQTNCVVCGNASTVRSHMFPRALVHRIRGVEKNIVEGDRNRPGLRISQAGLWDDGILCEKHEGSLASADDYMVRFCRKFEKESVLSPSGKSFQAPNPRPELLLRFAAATVWRHAVSRHGAAHHLKLGPYKHVIERHLFENSPLPLEAIVGRSNIVDLAGKRLEIGLAPYKRKFLRWTVWHFTIAGFDFYLKADNQRFPSEWKEFLANDNNPITMPVIDPLQFHEIPMFQPIFAQMRKAGW